MNAISTLSVGATGLDLLAALHGQCFDDAWSRSFLARVLATPGAFAMIGAVAPMTEPAGFLICRVGGGEGEVLSIGVLPGQRRRGVARGLLRAGLAKAATFGADKIYLEVAADNISAHDLYKGLGFLVVGVRPAYYSRPGGTTVDALVLCRDLTSTMS